MLKPLPMLLFEYFPYLPPSSEHPPNVSSAMAEIMTTILAESEEISQDLLTVLLENLKMGEKVSSFEFPLISLNS